MIKSDNEEYFIEPLERGKQMEEEKGRIHVVYKRSAVERAPVDRSADFQYRGRLLDVTVACNENRLPTPSRPDGHLLVGNVEVANVYQCLNMLSFCIVYVSINCWAYFHNPL